MKISKARLKSIILEELQGEENGTSFIENSVNKIMGDVKKYNEDPSFAKYKSRIPILKRAINRLLDMDEAHFKMVLMMDYGALADMFLNTPLEPKHYNFENAKEVLRQLKARLEQQEGSATDPQNPTTPQMENKQMKITKARLKTIILEELTRVMREQGDESAHGSGLETAKQFLEYYVDLENVWGHMLDEPEEGKYIDKYAPVLAQFDLFDDNLDIDAIGTALLAADESLQTPTGLKMIPAIENLKNEIANKIGKFKERFSK